jgi:hypothetical protein
MAGSSPALRHPGAAAIGSPRPQALADLAMAKDEVKARLAPIPVFTVANPKNEFVLVAGEVSIAQRLGDSVAQCNTCSG